ncbi:uncharacterized protein LOC116732539 isoform X1 [Xiphophorus hellerii]|uniref:uncharacterized protein LOC116732539 isoform X1 n=2 Tax=Xiphophorus hellerii TaxID=8084 RepID=UPI0013B42255|nr:uncharacterized protein LOC116732539 isoform X1 [Xiphophorus hellerii]
MLEEKKAVGSPQERKTSNISRKKIQSFNARNGNVASTNGNVSNHPQSFSLLLENCAPCPAPGVLTTPLLSGLPGSASLTGRQAASLQLAQLKAQLALTQMNNVLAVGGCAPTLTSNTHIPALGLPTKPPSPTAVAINLLNLLKIANTMSHPMYNPFAPGKQMPSQGPYGLSGGQMEMDPRKPPPHFGSGSNFSSSGSSGLTRGLSGGPIPSIMSLPGNYRPERNKITVDDDIDRCLDLNISRAREEVIQTSSSQNTQFTNVQRDIFPSSNKGMPSYLTSPATLVNRSFTVDSSNNSLDWLPICQRGSEEESSKKYSSASSSFLSSGASLFSTSSEGKHMSSTPGLGDYDIKRPAKSVPPPEPIRPKYTSESASNILLHFGLEKEDLEHLISYPEDQITPENLPFILRQIKLEKEKKAATAVQSKPYSATQPIRSMGENDKFIPSIRAGFNSDQISSTVLKPSKVIEYGHTGKYTTGVGNEVGRTISSSAVTCAGGSLLYTDTFKPSSHVRDPLQRCQGELKTGPVVSSHSQMSAVSTVDSLRSPVASSSSDLSKKLGVQTSQNSTSLFPSFGLLNKDTELRLLKPEDPQIPSPKQPEPVCQASTQPQPFSPPCNLSRGVHPGRPGLVLIHSNDSRNNNKSKTQGQGLKAPEQVNKIPAQQQPILQHQGPPPQKPQFQMHLQPIPPLKQVQQGLPSSMPPRLSLFPVCPALPTPAQVPIHPPLPMPAPMLLRSSIPTPAQGRMDAMPRMPPPVFKDQTSVPKMGPSKLPTPAMMQDYAAATPRIFPHTCCLCMKECTNMKDWLSHQNTSLHLNSCRLLRLRYPDWDGTTLELLSGPGKGTQASPTTLGQSSHETRSHSLSPHRQRGSEDRKESPHHHYGSESRRQKRSSRSRSRSPQRHYSSDGQRERRSSRSPHTSRHSRRSRSRSYDRPTSSHHRSRSRSYERRSPPRKREAKRSSPRRSYERRSSPRRSDERHSSPRRSREARSPAERSAPQHKRSRSADRLAKRLLETTAVQSLSKQSNLEAMVKTLAPALLAELAKMKSSSNTEKTSSAKSSKATSSHPKSGKSSSAKPMTAESLSAGKVRLSSVSASLSHDDIFDALEKFGKVKEVIIARASLQAVIHFEKEADAEKLKKLQCLQVKGLTVYVDKKMNVVSKKPQSAQKSASQKKSAESSTTFTGKDKTPAIPGAKTITTGKVATKAKGVPIKQVAVKKLNTAGKCAVKPVGVKTTAGSGVQKTISPVKTSDADDSKDEATNTKPESDEIKSAETPSETAEVLKTSDTTVSDEDKEEKMASQVKEVTPEAETSSDPVKAETQPDTLGVKDLESKSAPSENQLAAAKAESEELPLVTKTVDTVETSEDNQVEECLKVDSIGIKVEDVEPGKTEPEEPIEILSSAESKHQVSETVKPAARVKTPPCSSSPCKTSPDPPPTQQATVKTEEMLVTDSSQVQPCPMEESELPARKLKTESEQPQSPKKTETKQKDVSSHLTPEPVSDVVAVKLEEPTSAGKKTADGAMAPADIFSLTATVKTEKQEQQKETKHTPEKTVKSSMPLSKDSHNKKQPPPQTCASVSPTPAEPIQSGSFKADMKAGKNETEVGAIPTVTRKSSENSERKQPLRAAVVTAEKQTAPVPYTSTMSVTALGKPEDNAELPQINEDFFRALTTALREHRLRQGEKKTSEESFTVSKTTSEGMKEEYTPLTKDESKEEDNYSDPFDEFDFNFGDFVTVDEISEEMDDTLVEDTSVSLESISRDTTERLSPDVSSAASKTSTRSSKACKSSTSSSSKSEKGSDSLSSTSDSKNKQKLFSEPPKFETKPSFVSGVKSKSSSPPSNSLKTPLSSAHKSQSNKSKPPVRSSETSYSVRSTRLFAAVIKSSVGTQQVGKRDVKPKEIAVAKSDHHVSAESCSANTVESELRIKTSKIQPTEGQSSQIQNLKTDFKNVKEMKKNEVKDKKKDMDGESTEEKRGYNENKQILDSFNEKSDEQKNKDDNQDRRTGMQLSGPEQDQLIHQGADNDNSPSDGCQEMEVDESTKLQDCTLKHQAATTHDEETNQTPNSSSVKQNNDIRSYERVCETSREVGQTSNEEDQNDSRHFDTLKDQKLVFPTDLLSKADDEPTNEEAYEVIDSLDDQPATTEAESEMEKKEQRRKESATTSGDDKPTRKGCSRSRIFKSEEKENSLKQQDKTRTYVTRTKDSKTEKEEESLEDFEEMVYEVVDSIEDESVKEPSTTGRCSSRRTPRGNKKDEKTSTPVEDTKKSDDEEEDVFTVLDSVEEESSSDKPVVTRSTRGRRQNIAKKVEQNTKTKEDKTPTRRRCTPVRDSKEKEKEKTPKIDVPLKESALTKSDSGVPSTGDEDTICMELDAVEYDQPTTQKPRRGRPKDNKTSQKQSEEEEEPVYQIVDSLEEDQENTMTVTSSLQKKSETNDEMTADVNIVSLIKVKEDKSPTRRHTPARDAQEKDRVHLKECAQTKKIDTAVKSTCEVDDTCKQLIVVKEGQSTTQKSKRGRPKKDNKTSKKQTEEEEEPVYQIVDSLEEDQENTMTVESSLHEDSKPNIEMTADFNTVLFTKLGEDKTLTRRKCTPTRDSHEKDVVPLKESTPTQASNAPVVNPGEEDTIIYAVEDGQPATQKPGRGRPKKNNKTSKKLTEEEETVYQIVDTVEGNQDKTMMVAPIHIEETEAKVEMTEDVNTVLFSKMKEDKILTRGQCTPARNSQEKYTVPLKESTPTKKSDDAVTSTGDEDNTCEELDAAEDGQPTTQKPRRGRPKKDNKTSKKQTEEDEEPVYQIVDSLEEDQEKNVMEEASLLTESETNVEMTANANTDLLTKTKEDKNLTKRRRTPARDSQENDREKTPKPDVCVPLIESTPTKKSDMRDFGGEEATYEVLDAVEEVVRPATQASRRGRPKKDNKISEKQTEYLKVDLPRKDDDEEEATYQILDSVEDEVVGDPAPVDQSECTKTSSAFADDDITKEIIRSLLNEEEGGTIYQIVDSLEEDQVQEETMTETAMQEGSETTGDMVASTDHVLSSPSTVEPSEQAGREETPLAGKTLEDKEDPSAKDSDTEGKESTLKADVVGEDESLNQPNHVGASEKNIPTSPKSKDTEATENILVNLDQVSEDEEDYPDDAAEEEELKKRQAAAKKREDDRKDKMSREREAMQRRSRSSSRGGSRKSTWEPEKTSQEDFEKVEVDAQDLVTLDEVGEDEVGEEAVTETPTWKVELAEGELQDLVTLDEIVEEEEGQLEAPPQSLESQFKDSLKSETLPTLTETTQIEDNKDDDNHPKEPSSSSKRKLDDITEECGNFVTVDEVGEIEEEEEKEAVTRRGRPRKRSRLTSVRKSARGKTVKEEKHRQEEEENKSLPSASLDSSSTLDTSGPSGDVQCETQRIEEGKNTEAASTEHQPLPNDGLKLGFEEAERREHRRTGVEVVDKRKQEPTGPEAKRSRSQPPSVSVNLQLPPFNPKNPLGKEFVNPTSGFFCSLCSVFYLNEDTAKEIHCSSQEHYDNLKNYYQRLQQNVQGSLSD